MSKVVTNDIVGQLFNPIVTSADWTQLNNLMEAGPIDSTNSVIFSVPNVTYKNGENGELEVQVSDTKDIVNEASIWITDNLGNLYPMSFPYSMIKDTIEQVKNFFNNKDNVKSITEIYFNNSIEGSSLIGNSVPSVYSSITVVYNDGSTRDTQPTSFQIYTTEQCHESDKYNGSTIWYNTEGTYYIIGYYEGESTKNILKWKISAPIKLPADVSYISTPNDRDGTLTILIKADVTGKFNIDIISGNITCVSQPSEYTNITANSYAKFVFSNSTDEDIRASFTYSFIPLNTVEYIESLNIPFSGIVPAVKIEIPYYFYVGPEQPTSSTSINNIVTGGTPGWHLIGDSLSDININHKAHDSSNPSNMISVEPTYETEDGIDYYIVIPEELYIYDGLGNNITGATRYTNLGNIEIQGHTYKVIKDHDFDFIFNIY